MAGVFLLAMLYFSPETSSSDKTHMRIGFDMFPLRKRRYAVLLTICDSYAFCQCTSGIYTNLHNIQRTVRTVQITRC